jgi:hypothetical protein
MAFISCSYIILFYILNEVSNNWKYICFGNRSYKFTDPTEDYGYVN